LCTPREFPILHFFLGFVEEGFESRIWRKLPQKVVEKSSERNTRVPNPAAVPGFDCVYAFLINVCQFLLEVA